MTDQSLSLIDLDQPIPGHRRFISCWLRRAGELTFIVDPGPASTIPVLLAALERLSVSRLDFVLLTHIHLDHAGGTNEVLEAFPGVKVHCHAAGIEHLVEPERLWQGSVEVLGDTATVYGRPRPVPAERFAADGELRQRGIRPIPTPGHAKHHLAYTHGDVLFAGEAFGTSQELPSGRIYMRPATPQRFFLDQALASIDRLATIEPEPRIVAFAHHGSRLGARALAAGAREQMLRWVAVARELLAKSADDLDERMFARLMEVDPLYGQGRFDELDEDFKPRERHYLGNSLVGIRGWIESNPEG
ncbi:MAG TPA: MBL fold metallo-hydrolase [Polyangia bacterium]|nr:MBL fold metallo-hydrolase [Polyangia bacterium]